MLKTCSNHTYFTTVPNNISRVLEKVEECLLEKLVSFFSYHWPLWRRKRDLSFLTIPIGFDFGSPLHIGSSAQVHKTYSFHVVWEVFYLVRKPERIHRAAVKSLHLVFVKLVEASYLISIAMILETCTKCIQS